MLFITRNILLKSYIPLIEVSVLKQFITDFGVVEDDAPIITLAR